MTTRTDDLTDRLLDGTLTDAEWAELDALLAADPAAAADHLALLELEAALRGLRTEFDLSEPTLAKVREAQAEKTTRAVLAEISTGPAPDWAARRPRGAVWWRVGAAALVATAAGLLVGLWLGAGTPAPVAKTPTDDGQLPAPQFARVTRSLGSVEIIPPLGDAFPAAEGREVPPGHTLRTLGEDSLARVELPDRTTVDIESDSVVRFAPGGSAGSRLFLAAGQLTAAVPDGAGDRRFVVGTGAGDVSARAGTFVVSSAGPESARVDVRAGKVEVVRADAPTPLSFASGGAFFQSGLERVVTEPALRTDRVPARTLAFTGARSAVYSPDGAGVWAASAKQLTWWTRDGGTADTVFAPRKGNDGFAALFTPDKTALVTFVGTGKEDKTTVRDLPGGEERVALPFRLPEARFWTVAPGAAWFAAADPKPNHKRVRVLDGATGEERFTREFADPVGCVAASPDGRTLAVGLSDLGRGVNNKVVLLDPAGEAVGVLPVQRKGLNALAFSADGRLLAAGFNGLVQVWDVRTRELVRSITGFERVVTCLAFAPDARAVAAGTQDGQVWVWDARSGAVRQLIEVGSRGVRSVAFGPDGRRLVTVANDAPVAVWDVADPAPEVQ
ncbi:MAG: hypothetical protein C0501_30120 [Isosphaera sp.]|nr:hypothetical protein [Isosphaera sp.]